MDQIQKIKELVTPVLEKEEIALYDVLWHNEGSMRILQVAIMKKDGTMDIDTCADMSEKISECLDEADLITSEYFLEVCSPGAERELKDMEQIKGALGEYVYLKLKDPKAGLDEVKGYLKEVKEDSVLIEYMDKAVKKKADIALDNVSLIRLSVKI